MADHEVREWSPAETRLRVAHFKLQRAVLKKRAKSRSEFMALVAERGGKQRGLRILARATAEIARGWKPEGQDKERCPERFAALYERLRGFGKWCLNNGRFEALDALDKDDVIQQGLESLRKRPTLCDVENLAAFARRVFNRKALNLINRRPHFSSHHGQDLELAAVADASNDIKNIEFLTDLPTIRAHLKAFETTSCLIECGFDRRLAAEKLGVEAAALRSRLSREFWLLSEYPWFTEFFGIPSSREPAVRPRKVCARPDSVDTGFTN